MTEQAIIQAIRVQTSWYCNHEADDLMTRDERAAKIDALECALVEQYDWDWEEVENLESLLMMAA